VTGLIAGVVVCGTREPKPLPPPLAEPVTAQAEGQPSKPAQSPSVQTPAKAIARQPRKATATVPVAKPVIVMHVHYNGPGGLICLRTLWYKPGLILA